MRPARARRAGLAPGMGLAFLDVLCCGLGSAVFLLLVIQHGPSPVAAEELLVADGIARVESEIEAVDRRIAGARGAIASVTETIRSAFAAMQALAGLSELQKQQAGDALAALQSERARLAAETAALSSLRARSPAPPVTPRQHLTGLRIEDDRVAVFLDSSASMLDSTLVGILRLRVSNDRLKRAAGKWTTARNALRWVYDRVPDGGRYRLFHYSDGIRELRAGGTATVGPTGWHRKAGGVRPAVPQGSVEAALDALVPDGATNLRQVFETAARLSPPPAQILLITDGLPTLPGETPLQRLRHCRRPRSNTTPLITAECRASIFRDAVRVPRQSLRNVRIDVILLPLEGDARAVGHYWDLALAAGGRLLTPAHGWPET